MLFLKSLFIQYGISKRAPLLNRLYTAGVSKMGEGYVRALDYTTKAMKVFSTALDRLANFSRGSNELLDKIFMEAKELNEEDEKDDRKRMRPEEEEEGEDYEEEEEDKEELIDAVEKFKEEIASKMEEAGAKVYRGVTTTPAAAGVKRGRGRKVKTHKRKKGKKMIHKTRKNKKDKKHKKKHNKTQHKKHHKKDSKKHHKKNKTMKRRK